MLFTDYTLRLIAETDFTYAGTVGAAAVGLTVSLACCCRRTWPDIGEMIACQLALAGTLSGLKLIVLAFHLTPEELGGLRDDRIALVIGGGATICYALREVVEHWVKTVKGAKTPKEST
ncbi:MULTISPECIES: hypothetical protein [unclassified Cupriavidus]|uniref:hypothetical protein n=1 Tax=Cupriavidus sp. H19C3 TaxID=3241603 RepID=UPI0011D92071|nr:MAG: hypothetical protein E6Q40_08430 [Cupriavidus sp.]